MFRVTFIIIATIIFSGCFASINPVLIEGAKVKYVEALMQLPSVEFSSRIDRHKAIIASYFIETGDLVLDLGAFVGDCALYYSQLVGDAGKIIAYEASPTIFSHLTTRLERFNTSNILARQKAISRSSAQRILMKIYPYDIDAQCSSVEPLLWYEDRMPGNTQIVEVETERLDDLVMENDKLPIHFIKIDVEGHEHAVFEGAQNLLKTQRPLVIFEYGYVEGFWDPGTILQMEEMGYICFDCNTDERVYPGFDVHVTDILAIPLERAKEVAELLPFLY